MAQGKKHYAEEIIVLQNGDEVYAKNLPISKLKIFHKEFQRWSDHLKNQEKRYNALVEEAEEKAGGDEDKSRKILADLVDKEAEDSDEDLTYVDVATDCALIALQCWRIRSTAGKTVEPESIDRDYVEEYVDLITLDRVLQVAGAMNTGDVNELEGKARG